MSGTARSYAKLPILSLAQRAVRAVTGSVTIVQFIGKMRRLYLVTFRRAYVAKQLALRKGECLRCGRCCALCFTCPFLKTNQLCLIHGLWRSRVCVTFPIDERDLNDLGVVGAECGFYFPDEGESDAAVQDPDRAAEEVGA